MVTATIFSSLSRCHKMKMSSTSSHFLGVNRGRLVGVGGEVGVAGLWDMCVLPITLKAHCRFLLTYNEVKCPHTHLPCPKLPHAVPLMGQEGESPSYGARPPDCRNIHISKWVPLPCAAFMSNELLAGKCQTRPDRKVSG